MVLFVRDADRSHASYSVLLDMLPIVVDPGMVIFALAPGVELGLMPEAAIRRLLPALPAPPEEGAAPRCELYLRFADLDTAWNRGLEAGGRPLSLPAWRDWQERAGYLLDPDGHVIACAQLPGCAVDSPTREVQ